MMRKNIASWNDLALSLILTTFSFDNFQFWLFSSKIFESIKEQQQQQYSDCMDLAIKKCFAYSMDYEQRPYIARILCII